MFDSKDDISTNVQEVDRHAFHTRDQDFKSRRRPWWGLGGEDRSFATARPEALEESSTSLKGDVQTVNRDIQQSVFSDPQAAEFYEPIDSYEGRHRFDPHATWSQEEERKLVRRVSLDFQYERDERQILINVTTLA